MSFTDKLFDAYRGQIRNLNLVASSGGAFEVSVNDNKVYSKLEKGEFPDYDQLVKEIGDTYELKST